jgi:hypothetical protein
MVETRSAASAREKILAYTGNCILICVAIKVALLHGCVAARAVEPGVAGTAYQHASRKQFSRGGESDE